VLPLFSSFCRIHCPEWKSIESKLSGAVDSVEFLIQQAQKSISLVSEARSQSPFLGAATQSKKATYLLFQGTNPIPIKTAELQGPLDLAWSLLLRDYDQRSSQLMYRSDVANHHDQGDI
jgi:hypothetical protein